MKTQDYTEELINLRRHFHQHPELALQEVETSAYICIYLEKLGYTVTAVETYRTDRRTSMSEKKREADHSQSRNGCTADTGADWSALRICKSGLYACLRT